MKNIGFILDGKRHDIKSHGVQVTIIDYTLSRSVAHDGQIFYCDLAQVCIRLRPICIDCHRIVSIIIIVINLIHIWKTIQKDSLEGTYT